MFPNCRSRKVRKDVAAILFAVALISAAPHVFAQTYGSTTNTGTNINTGRTAESYVEGKYGYVTVSGTVSRVLDKDRFSLDYGNGVTQIDYDDALHDLFHKSARQLKVGDKVTVTGKIDDNWFSKHEILASSILQIVDNYTVLYKHPEASQGDEVPAIIAAAQPSLFLSGQVALTGIVTGIVYKNSFTIHYEDGTIEVNNSGIRIPDTNRIVSGDVVTVYGKIENSFFKNRQITAETIEKIGVYSRVSPDGH